MKDKGFSSRWKRHEGIGLAIIGASIAVALVITGFVLHTNRETKHTLIQVQSQRLSHAFASISHDAASLDNVLRECLKAASGVERDEHFAYLVVRDENGGLAGQIARPGVVVPSVAPRLDPSSWYSERIFPDASGRTMHESVAPILANGEYVGSASLAFFEPGYLTDGPGWSFMAALSLPVILLGAFFYVLFRFETYPIIALSSQLQNILECREPVQGVGVKATGLIHELVEKLNGFLEKNRIKVSAMEKDQHRAFTSQKILQYKLERLESLLEEFPEGLLIMDDNGVITFANGWAGDFIDIECQEMIGKRFSDWCRNEPLAELLRRYCGITQRLRRQSGVEINPAHLPGTTIAVNAYPLAGNHDGNSHGTLVVFRDMTCESLARQSRGEFVAHVAHELKSPLNVLKMYSEMLLGEEGKDESFRIEAVNTIYDEVDRLSALITSLLSISKIEMGSITLDRQRVKLLDLLADVFETMQRNDRGHDLRYSLELPNELSPISADKDLFRVALNNLLTNAIKYNVPGGSVTLQAEENPEEIIIRVLDTGLGMTPEVQLHIFDKFYRSDEEQVRAKPGHGLGLSLAKSIIELHHGKLEVQSAPGSGSQFTIVLAKGGGLVKEGI